LSGKKLLVLTKTCSITDYKQVAPLGLIFDKYIFLLQTERRYTTKKSSVAANCL